MTDKEFTCPKCGSACFGRDVKIENGKVTLLPTVHCNYPRCGWRGEWPQKESNK